MMASLWKAKMCRQASAAVAAAPLAGSLRLSHTFRDPSAAPDQQQHNPIIVLHGDEPMFQTQRVQFCTASHTIESFDALKDLFYSENQASGVK